MSALVLGIIAAITYGSRAASLALLPRAGARFEAILDRFGYETYVAARGEGHPAGETPEGGHARPVAADGDAAVAPVNCSSASSQMPRSRHNRPSFSRGSGLSGLAATALR